MTTVATRLTLDEFLRWDDGSESLYELENGQLIPMPAESEVNQRIAMFLILYLGRLGIGANRLRRGTEIMVSSGTVGVRVPDLVILSEELAQVMQGATRSLVTLEMPPPLLVVEIVSPGQEKRDYRYKRSEYAARAIPEYWIVDPLQNKVTILEWVEGWYEECIFTGQENLVSPQLGTLSITADMLLSAREEL
ncbi:MAG: Uma2 family endonuclease [Gloeomargarita sp. SKYG116]|nr:Uma2 family endonuclease [Gloeomargarita sp. SKYG116]MDW8401562.1 Uma2 family endonuclease [Gloeomargarita sp. SKYGB_i_bin116]